jgi:hypothetical protein|tara:strand:- start:1894 stop:2640 length:747 start_codon:yes stop_codon:yes gene_type:complete
MSEENHKFPTETIELPSKGLIYPEDNPLSSGKVEMKYMTAKEEDILSNQSYIENGTVLDKLMKALIVTKCNYSDLIVGDKNAVMIAARILGYGKDYKFEYKGEEVEVDLTTLENKEFDENSITRGVNEFQYTLPNAGTEITYKLLSHKDEMAIDAELKGLKKINKKADPSISTRMKQMILSVNGDSERKTVREFVDTYFLAMDARAFRKHVAGHQPDVNLLTQVELNDGEEDVEIPITVRFFWPDANL